MRGLDTRQKGMFSYVDRLDHRQGVRYADPSRGAPSA
jgi:hypothetical protein